MKIVGPNRNQVQSLGRQQYAPEGKTMLNVFNELAGKTINKITERQEQKTSLYAQTQDAEFWRQWGGRDHFDVSELPGHMVTEGREIGGRVMASEVLPMMYKDHMENTLREGSKMIDMPSAKENWMNSARSTMLGRLTNIQIKANAALDKQIFADQQINYNVARESRQPGLQLEIANGMNTTDSNREVFASEARSDAEIISYEDMITEDRIEDIRDAIDYLSQPVEKYEGSNGQLDSTSRLVWKNKLESELGRSARVSGSVDKAEMEELKRKMRITNANGLAGKAASLDEYAELRAKAVSLNADGGLTAEILDLDAAAIFVGNRNLMNKSDVKTRDQYIESIENDESIPEFERNQLLRKLQTANEAQSAMEKTDLMRAAVEAGFIRELSPIDFNEQDPAMFSKQLLDRQKQFQLVEANYGQKLGQGILTKDESMRFSAQLDKMSIPKQMDKIMAIADSFGPEATGFYQQITKQGTSRSFSIAGITAMNGHRAYAEQILTGAKYYKENPEEFRDLKKLVDLKLVEELGSVFWRKPKKQAAVKEAILHAYIGITNGQEKTIDDGGPFSPDLWNEAIIASTGGILNQGGGKMSAPVYGMNQKQWDTWIKDLDPKYIEELGGVKGGLSGTDLIKGIKDGDYRLEDTAVQGDYIVLRNDGIPLAANTKRPSSFIFKYSVDAARLKPMNYRTGRRE